MDSDFLILAAQGSSHAGIAYAKPGTRSVGQLIQKLSDPRYPDSCRDGKSH
jgi:hypothetical protein